LFKKKNLKKKKGKKYCAIVPISPFIFEKLPNLLTFFWEKKVAPPPFFSLFLRALLIKFCTKKDFHMSTLVAWQSQKTFFLNIEIF
jgi:hypothetical protein